MSVKEIPNFEKEIYEKIDFTNELLRKRNKYSEDGKEYFYFKLNDVKLLLKTIDYPYKYSGENSHIFVLKEFKEFKFKVSFFIKNNSSLPYFRIFKDDIFIGPKVTNLYSIFNYLPYDESLLNQNFMLNTLEDLKSYVLDIIELINKFIEEYIIAIEEGKVQI